MTSGLGLRAATSSMKVARRIAIPSVNSCLQQFLLIYTVNPVGKSSKEVVFVQEVYFVKSVELSLSFYLLCILKMIN